MAVSYTHLDVYKRQLYFNIIQVINTILKLPFIFNMCPVSAITIKNNNFHNFFRV